jgi:hypothetical protein
MPRPGLIARYLDSLAGQLPGSVVEELADGLEETYRRHLGLGLTPEAAAEAAVTEFGDPNLIAAEFARGHPARRAARRLLVIGPVVGVCWAVALLTGHAWAWPVPMAARIVPGAALVAIVALLAVAAGGVRYRFVGRAGAAGCIGTAALDAFMIIGVLAADPAARWAVAVAVTASAARLALNMRLMRPVLAGNGLRDRGRHSLGPGRADDRGVYAVGDLVGRDDGDAGEPGPGQAVAVLGDGGCPGDAAGLATALEPLGWGEVVVGEDVGDA